MKSNVYLKKLALLVGLFIYSLTNLYATGIDFTKIYVRPDGNDANDGFGSSVSSAKKRIQAAINIAMPGQKIVVAPGTYFESTFYLPRSGKPDSAIVFLADTASVNFVGINSGQVIINGGSSEPYGFLLTDISYLVIDGFTFDYQTDEAIKIESSTNNVRNIVVANCKFKNWDFDAATNYDRKAISIKSGLTKNVANIKIHDCTFIAPTDAGENSLAIYTTGVIAAYPNDSVEIYNNIFNMYATTSAVCISLGGDDKNYKIYNNKFLNFYDGIFFTNGGSQNTYIYNNFFYSAYPVSYGIRSAFAQTSSVKVINNSFNCHTNLKIHPNNFSLYNNIFKASNYCFNFNNTSQLVASNYNLFDAAINLANYNAVTYTTTDFTAFKASGYSAGATDQNSKTAAAGFIVQNNPQIQPTSSAVDSAIVIDVPTFGIAITKDIRGKPRDNSSPTIGAYEVYGKLHGTYTIGGFNGDFATFTEAVAMLTSAMLDGPVTFDVSAGNFNESIVLPKITGASEINTISFIGVDSMQSIIRNNLPNVITFANASNSYYKFKNIGIESLETGKCVSLNGNSTKISFENCRFNRPSATDTLVWAKFQNVGNVSFKNNRFEGGNVGLIIQNSVNNDTITIEGNTFYNQSENAVYIENADTIKFNYNRVETNSESYNQKLLVLNSIDTARITNNIFISRKGGEGIRINNCSGVSIYNNSIYIGSNINTIGRATGIYSELSDMVRIYHNTVRNDNSNSENGSSALTIYDNTAGHNIKNNILTCYGGSYTVEAPAPMVAATFDFNSLYTTGPDLTNIAAEYYTIAMFVGEGILNCTDVNPILSSSDTLVPLSCVFSATGTDLTSIVPKDLKKTSRSATPSLGTIEFANTPITSGDIYIGKGKQFEKLSDAFAALQSCGNLTDSVRLLLTDATYLETQAITFDSIPGMSADHRIIIKPAPGNQVLYEFKDIPNVNVITFRSPYITIDGSNNNSSARNMEIAAVYSSVSMGALLKFDSNSNDIIIKNTIISGTNNTGDGYSAIEFDTALNVLIQNNHIRNASTGIRVNDTISNSIIRNNLIGDANVSYYINKYGIELRGSTNAVTIENNEIFNIIGPLECKGMYLNRLGNSTIRKNNIHDVVLQASSSAYGIHIIPSGNGNDIIENNIIRHVASGGNIAFQSNPIGLFIGLSNLPPTNPIKVYYNSIYLNHDPISGLNYGSSMAIGALVTNDYNYGNPIDFQNNIVQVSLGTSTAIPSAGYAMYYSGQFPFSALDYNTYFVSNFSSNFVGNAQGSPVTNMINWRSTTNKDSNSFFANPQFTSITNLRPLSTSFFTSNNANVIAGITTDYADSLRNATTPDRGAYEFIAGSTLAGHITADTVIDYQVIMSDTVWVDAGVTLTFNPGAQILVLEESQTGSKFPLNVNGTLMVNGTSADTIQFKAIDGGRWGGIKFMPGANDASKISYCSILGNAIGFPSETDTAISITQANITIEHFNVVGKQYAIKTNNASPSILNSSFITPGADVLYLNNGGKPLVKGCNFNVPMGALSRPIQIFATEAVIDSCKFDCINESFAYSAISVNNQIAADTVKIMKCEFRNIKALLLSNNLGWTNLIGNKFDNAKQVGSVETGNLLLSNNLMHYHNSFIPSTNALYVYSTGNSKINFFNNTVYSSTSISNQFFYDYPAGGTVLFNCKNSIIQGFNNPFYFFSTDTIVENNYIQNYAYGVSNSQADPMLANTSDGNFNLTLQNGSPCLDAGNTDIDLDSLQTTTDYLGKPRFVGNIDIGAYEQQIFEIGGNALAFNTDGQYVSFGDVMGTFSQITIETWVNVTDNWNRKIISKGNTFSLELSDDRRPYLALGANGVGWVSVYAFNSLPLNTWHHIAATWDGAIARMYIDGIFEGSVAQSQSLYVNTDPVLMSSTGAPYSLRAKIDELRIWNTSLTQAQIQDSMHTSVSASAPGLWAYYNFDQRFGSSLTDLSPSGFNGTLYSSPDTNWVESGALIVPFIDSLVQQTATSLTAYWDSIPAALGYDVVLNEVPATTPITATEIGSTNNQHTFTGLTEGKQYKFEVRSKMSATKYSDWTAKNLQLIAPPKITYEPTDKIACETSLVTFTDTAVGANLNYKWEEFNGTSWSQISTSPNLSMTAILANNGYQYRLIVTGDFGKDTSNVVTLTVNQNTAITSEPSGLVLCEGEPATFTVVATGTNTTYQWQKDDVDISGANSNTYTIAAVAAGDVASYKCIVHSDCGADVTSNTADLNVYSYPVVSIGSNSPICEGDNLNLSETGTGSATWSWSGPNGFTSTDQNPTIASAAIVAAGEYTVLGTNANGCTSTASQTITVTARPSAPSGSTPQIFCGSATIESLAVSGTDIKWYDVPSGGTSLAALTALVSGSAYFATQTENGCESSSRLMVTDTIHSIPNAPTGATDQQFCGSATIENIVVAGTGIKWYDVPSGGTALIAGTVLINGSTYYASQTVSGCESATRLDVTVVINETPTITANASVNICSDAIKTIVGYSTTTGSPDVYSIDFNFMANDSGFVDVVDAALLPDEMVIDIPMAAGPSSYSAELIVKNTATGCVSGPYSLNFTKLVNISPTAVITGNDTICNGGNSILTAIGGDTYRWFNGSTLDNVNVSPGVTTEYFVVAYDLNGCYDSAKYKVSVNPIPPQPTLSISPSTNVCTGEMVTYMADSGYDTYMFYDNPNGSFSPAQPGNTYTAPVSFSVGNHNISVGVWLNGCSNLSDETTITVNESPVVNFTSSNADMCVLNTRQLTANPVGGSFGITSGTSSIDGSNVLTATNAGSLEIQYSYTDGTCSNTVVQSINVNAATSSSISETACGSYTAPDGAVYTTSGIKTAIIPNGAGCDSTITIDLTINSATSSSISETACGSYTAPDGAVYTTSGIKTAIIPNGAGCDSTITIDLTINSATSSSISEIACGSYTAPDGAVYSTSGIKTAIIPNGAGCDSIITIDLTIEAEKTVSVSIVASETSVCIGTEVTYTATPVNGGASPTYIWYVNNVENNASITEILNYIPVSGDVVKCVLTSNDGCIVTPDAASNDVVVVVSEALDITLNVAPRQNNICNGTEVVFDATVSSGSGTYQWKVNGINVGANVDTFAYTPQNNDLVSCEIVTDVSCANNSTAVSNDTTMLVSTELVTDISISTASTQVCANAEVTFTATSTVALTAPVYQWKVNGVNVGSNSNIYVYIPTNKDTVTCELINNAACAIDNPATSNSIIMDVLLELPVSVSVSPSANNVCDGTTVIFIATPTNGGAMPAYQWKVNGSNVGTNSATYSYTPVNSDAVTCILTSNATCADTSTATSSNVVMNVDAPIIVNLNKTDKDLNGKGTITVLATGGNSTFLYSLNGGSFIGGNYFDNLDSGTYKIVVKDGMACLDSTVAIIEDKTPPCNAVFTSVVDTVDKLKIIFTNTSQGVTDYYWSFGDGDNSNLPSPEHIYLKNGSYNVCLNTYNINNNCMSSSCLDIVVGGNDPSFVSAKFNYTVDSLKVTFTDSSTNASQYYWVFGDGGFSPQQNPVYTFKKAGNYNVCLKVFNKTYGTVANYCVNILAGAPSCTAVADFSYTINASDSVSFTNLSTGSINAYYWNFGNGFTSSAQSVKYQYTKPGYYFVSLAVRDTNSGCASYASDMIKVGVVNCKADFDVDIDIANKSVQFINNSQGELSNYFWLFGDNDFSTQQNPLHTFGKTGLYNISLTVADATGSCVDYFEKPVQIGEMGCNARYTYYVDSSALKGYFYSSDLDDNTQRYWLFGDGKYSTEANPNHSFPAAGLYNVSLTTYNPSNLCMDYYTEPVLVGSLGVDCEADFAYTNQDDPQKIKFIDQSKGNINNWLWNFGNEAISSDPNPEHVFNTTGFYNVCLTVYNNFGVSNITCKDVLVGTTVDDNCKAEFSYYTDTASRKVLFTDNSYGAIDVYNWDFGDSTNSSEKNPEHIYAEPGYYLVYQEVANTVKRCSDVSLQLLNVSKPDMFKASFKYIIHAFDKKAGGYPVDLVGAGLGDDARLKWDFGDGSTDSTTNSPSHLYTDTAIREYNVCLTYSDPITGAEDTYCEMIKSDQLCLNDINAPTAICKGTYELVLDQGGNGTLSADQLDNGSYDDCYLASKALSKTAFNTSNIGNNNVKFIVTDVRGNADTCEVVVTVKAGTGIAQKEIAVNLSVYPNPIDKLLNIKFNLLRDSETELYITDLLGKRVASVMTGRQTAGEKNIVFDATVLQSGSYILQLRANGPVSQRIIIKK